LSTETPGEVHRSSPRATHVPNKKFKRSQTAESQLHTLTTELQTLKHMLHSGGDVTKYGGLDGGEYPLGQRFDLFEKELSSLKRDLEKAMGEGKSTRKKVSWAKNV
jgi:hypothetical protein